MTLPFSIFEIIILCVIYSFCYGYMVTIGLKASSNSVFNFCWILLSFVLALFAPLHLGATTLRKLYFDD
jgi:hypothetical protein